MLELGSHRLCFLLQNRRNVPFVFPRGFAVLIVPRFST